MDRVTKEAQVGELKDKLGRVASIVLADYRGIDVPTVTELRDEFRKAQCEYRVVKNTLVKLAVKGTTLEGIVASTSRARRRSIFSYERPVGAGEGAPRSSPRTSAKFDIKGGYFEGRSSTPRASRRSRRCRARTSSARSCSRRSWRRRRELRRAARSAGAQNFAYLLSSASEAPGRRQHEPSATVSNARTENNGRRATGRRSSIQLSNLTVMQIAELTKKLEDKWGVKAAPVAVAAGPAAPAAAPPLPRPRRRPSSPSSSRTPARTRSTSSRRPRDHRPGPQGGQGPGRRRAQGRSRRA